MFRRLIFDHAALCTTIAFVVTATVYFGFLWRALKMKRPEIQRYENLPFAEENETPRHDVKA